MNLNAGQLVHEVTIQALTPGVDASGAPTVTPATLTTAWMAREADRRPERYEGQQLSGALLTRWTMRYRDDMDPDLVDVPATRRLLYQGRAYDITHAAVLDRQAGIVLMTLAASKVAV